MKIENYAGKTSGNTNNIENWALSIMKGKAWTTEEMELLDKNYSKHGLKCCELFPDRSLYAIKAKVKSLMIKKDKTIEDFKRLKAEIPMRSVAFYAKSLGVSVWTIRRYIKTIKIENYEARRAGRTGVETVG